MAHGYDTMMNPAIEDLIVQTESKFILVTLAAKRSREITNYIGQLNVGVGAVAPPQVTTESAKPLTIALEEIAEGKIQAVSHNPEEAEEASESDSAGESDTVLVSEDLAESQPA